MPWSDAEAQSRRETIKDNIERRLLAQADALDQRRTEQRPILRAALLGTEPAGFPAILDDWAGRGYEYAEWLRLAARSLGFKPEQLMPDFYVEDGVGCMIDAVDRRIDKIVNIFRKSAADIARVSPSDVTAIFESMRNELRNLETQSPPKKCQQPKNMSSIPQKLIVVQTIPPSARDDLKLSIEWDAQCYPLEQSNVDGTAPLTLPTVASILYDNGEEGPKSFCTGTLIAPNLVLTAAHCFCMTSAKHPQGQFFRTARACSRGRFARRGRQQLALDPTHHTVFLQHAGSIGVSRIVLNPDFRWTGRLPRADLAILVLDRSVAGITPTPINTINRLRSGTLGTGSGYGFYTPIAADGRTQFTTEVLERTGLKLQAPIRTGRCSAADRRRGMICWTYRREREGIALGSTCSGDSGGPLFAEHKGQTYLVGVTSAGGKNCQPGTRAYDFEVYKFRDWIARIVRRHGATAERRQTPQYVDQLKCTYCQTCDTELTRLITGSDPATSIKETANNPNPVASTEDSQTEVESEFDIEIVSPRADFMRVAVNCTPGLESEMNLKLRLVRQAEEEVDLVECVANTRSTVQSCEVPVKTGQRWRVDLTGAADRECQIMATALGE